MSTLTPLPEWVLGEAALMAASLLLLVLAVATGRWTAWLVGYLAALLALTVALVAGRPHGGPRPGDDPTVLAPDQPFSDGGVLDHAAPAVVMLTRRLETDETR